MKSKKKKNGKTVFDLTFASLEIVWSKRCLWENNNSFQPAKVVKKISKITNSWTNNYNRQIKEKTVPVFL